uniref:Uncharacterized protein n=1 Tax=Monodelphis domestica TaxID=13616 RepID=A0A5F8GTF2_MONDO
IPAVAVDHSQRIFEVWAWKLDDEMKKICQVIRKCNYIAMYTKFQVPIMTISSLDPDKWKSLQVSCVINPFVNKHV